MCETMTTGMTEAQSESVRSMQSKQSEQSRRLTSLGRAVVRAELEDRERWQALMAIESAHFAVCVWVTKAAMPLILLDLSAPRSPLPQSIGKMCRRNGECTIAATETLASEEQACVGAWMPARCFLEFQNLALMWAWCLFEHSQVISIL